MTVYRAAVKWPREASKQDIRRAVFIDVPCMIAELLDDETLTPDDVTRLADELMTEVEQR